MKEKYKQYYIGQIITLKASPDKQLQDKIERTGYIKNIDDAGQLFVDFTTLAIAQACRDDYNNIQMSK